MKELINKLIESNNLSEEELIYLIDNIGSDDKKYLFEKASEIRDKHYGNKVF